MHVAKGARMKELLGVSGPEARLRGLVGERLGLRPSALPDARLTAALKGLDVEQLAGLPALPTTAPAWQTVVDALVVGETNFFRQRAWFAQLEEHALGTLIAARQQAGRRRLRIWSAGCATGEEPYGIALVVRRLLRGLGDWDVRIVGTDVSTAALDAARLGRYRTWSLREVEPDVQSYAFTAVDDGRFELDPAVRAAVTFAPLNLAEGAPLPLPLVCGDVDLAICRNVLMYLTPDAQRVATSRLAGALALGGWLAVAPLEANTEWFPTLRVVNVPSAIFFHREAAA
jgi:chemotaxis protein methyltransferase CheR